MDLSPGSSRRSTNLYHLGQDGYLGCGVQGDETKKGNSDTRNGNGVERLTMKFSGLTPHGVVGKTKTKAELKTFPATALAIRLNSGIDIWQPGNCVS